MNSGRFCHSQYCVSRGAATDGARSRHALGNYHHLPTAVRIGAIDPGSGQDWFTNPGRLSGLGAGAINPGSGQDWNTNPGRPILIAAFRPGLNLPGLVATNPGRKPGLNPQSWQVEVACATASGARYELNDCRFTLIKWEVRWRTKRKTHNR